MSFENVKYFFDQHLEKYKIVQKIVDLIVVPSMLLMFIRIAFTMGYLKAIPFQQIFALINSIVNVLTIPVQILKMIVIPLAPEVLHFKSGYIEPIVIISIFLFLVIGFVNATIARKINNRIEWKRRQSNMQKQRNQMKIREWKGN